MSFSCFGCGVEIDFLCVPYFIIIIIIIIIIRVMREEMRHEDTSLYYIF